MNPLLAAFYYGGRERWQFGFESPNELACFLVMILPFAIILLLPRVPRAPDEGGPLDSKGGASPGRRGRAARIALGVCLLAGLTILLIGTYSRGGYVAYICALAAGLLLTPRRGPWLAALLVFCLGIVFFPQGTDRATTLQPGADRSIGNRLILWERTAVMVSDFPWTGVGHMRYNDIYNGWYQPSDRATSNMTAVNNALTAAVYHGLPALALLVAGALWGLFMTTRTVGPLRPLAAASLAGQVGFHVAGIFSCFLVKPWLVAVFCACALTGVLSAWKASGPKLATCRRAFMAAGAGALAVVAAMLACGHFLQARNGGFQAVTIADSNGAAMWAEGGSDGRAIIWVTRDSSLSRLARENVRPFFDKTRISTLVLGFNGRAGEEAKAMAGALQWLAKRGFSRVVLVGTGSGSASLWNILGDTGSPDYGSLRRIIIAGDAFDVGKDYKINRLLAEKSELLTDRTLMETIMDRQGVLPRFRREGGTVVDVPHDDERPDERRQGMTTERALNIFNEDEPRA